MKYRKRPVVIEAFQLGVNFMPRWFIDNENVVIYKEGPLEADIHTLEGVVHASNKDYIIKGVKGELYPCKPDIFEQTYEAVE